MPRDNRGAVGVAVLALGEQLARALEIVFQRGVLLGEVPGSFQLSVFAPDLGVALTVGDHRRVRHLRLELGEARTDLFDQLLDHETASLRAPR